MTEGALERLRALDASLRRRFRVVETRVELPGRAITVLHPANADDLITEEDFVRDERMPYWADLWPSGRVLAARLLGEQANGRSLIELGCGAGLVAAAAALAGFSVTASDYYDDALEFARVNAWRNANVDIAAMHLDWRSMPAGAPRFDVVVASDVLYEQPYGTLVAAAFARLLAANGTGIMADPGRIARDEFLRALEPLGVRVRNETEVPYEDGEVRQRIALLELERVAPSPI